MPDTAKAVPRPLPSHFLLSDAPPGRVGRRPARRGPRVGGGGSIGSIGGMVDTNGCVLTWFDAIR